MIYRNMIDVINEIERINKDFGTVEFMIYDNSFEDPYPKDKRCSGILNLQHLGR